MNIFITGGAGFIGANFVKYLLDKGDFDLTVYDNLSTGSKINLDRAIKDSQQKGKMKFIKGDILDSAKLNRVIKGHTTVVHLAAHTKVVESLKEPKTNFEVNAIGTFNLLEAARKAGIKKFIFASSNAAVGEQIPPINEKMIPKPLSPYGASKLYGESLCTDYFNSYGLDTISLRFANAYGHYCDHKTSVIAKFIRRAKKGRSLEIYGDGEQTRDFIHAKDVCQALYLSLNCHDNGSKNSAAGEIFQIATGCETRVIDLAEMIKKLISDSDKNEPQIIFKGARKGEIRKNFSDIRKAKKILGFKPRIELDSGLKELIN